MPEENKSKKLKIDLNDIATSLKEYKDYFLAELKKASETNKKLTVDEIAKAGKEIDEKITTQLKEWKKRKLSLPGLENEKRTFHYSKIALAQISPNGWKDVPDSDFEKDVCEQTAAIASETRSNNASSGAAGAYLIPVEESGQLIDLAMARVPIMELGPTIISGLRGNLPIPKITGRPTAYWVGEEEAPTESETTFGEINLRPKTLAAFTKVSRDLLYQSSGVAETIIKGQLVKSFALKMNQSLIEGTGTEKSIKGIQNFDGLTGTDALGSNGNRFTIDKGAEMQMNLDVANMLNGKLGYLMRPEVLSFLKRERVVNYSGQDSSAGMPINGSSVLMSQSELEDTLGYKIKTSTLISKYTKGTSTLDASRVFFGDWEQLIIGFWEGFELEASKVAGNAGGSAFTQRQVWINAFQGMDSNMLDETGMTVVADALCTASNFS